MWPSTPTADLSAKPSDLCGIEKQRDSCCTYGSIAIAARVDASRIAVDKAEPRLVSFAFKEAPRQNF